MWPNSILVSPISYLIYRNPLNLIKRRADPHKLPNIGAGCHFFAKKIRPKVVVELAWVKFELLVGAKSAPFSFGACLMAIGVSNGVSGGGKVGKMHGKPSFFKQKPPSRSAPRYIRYDMISWPFARYVYYPPYGARAAPHVVKCKFL